MESKPSPGKSRWQGGAGQAAVVAFFALLSLGARQVLSGPEDHRSGTPVVPATEVDKESRDLSHDMLPPLDLTGVEGDALARRMENEPMRVMAAIDRMENREEALRLAIFCANAVAGPHFDLLVAWARRQQDPSVAAGIFNELMPRWAHVDLEGCLDFAHGLGGDEAAVKAKERLLAMLPGRLGVEMLARLPVEERGRLLKQQPGRLAARNPEGAMGLIAQLPAGGTRDEALKGLVAKWASASDVYHIPDPMAAATQVQKISDETLRATGLRAVTAAWSQTNAPCAAEWTDKLPVGPDRDAAILGMVETVSVTDPGWALEWAKDIGDSDLRAEALKKLEK